MKKITTIKIDGTKYVTLKQLAQFLDKSSQTIFNLVSKGNVIRKMKSMKIGGTVFIPYSEIVEFPFTMPGSSARDNVYHYNYDGEVIEE
jgi:hypothetical protein